MPIIRDYEGQIIPSKITIQDIQGAASELRRWKKICQENPDDQSCIRILHHSASYLEYFTDTYVQQSLQDYVLIPVPKEVPDWMKSKTKRSNKD